MRTRTMIVAAVAAAALLAPAGIAVGHEPGNACTSEGASGEKNPHCADDHGLATALANRDSEDPDDSKGPDPDKDGDVGTADNCPTVYNPNQVDSGEREPDGHGNACDHANDIDDDGECDLGCDPSKVDDTDDPHDDSRYATDSDGDGKKDKEEDTVPPTPQEQLEAGLEKLPA